MDNEGEGILSLIPRRPPPPPLNLTRDGCKIFKAGKLMISARGQGHLCKPRDRLGQQLCTSPRGPEVSREPPAGLA